jgi:hypothetical protein
MQELPRLPRDVEAKSVEPFLIAFCIAFIDVSAETVTHQSKADADSVLTRKRILYPMSKISFFQLVTNRSGFCQVVTVPQDLTGARYLHWLEAKR